MTRAPRVFRLVAMLVLLVATVAMAGCSDRTEQPAAGPSAQASDDGVVVRLVADGVAVPGGPPLALRASVEGLSASGAARHNLVIYGEAAHHLEVREKGVWRVYGFGWTAEKSDAGSYAAVVPLLPHAEQLARIDIRLYTADQLYGSAATRKHLARGELTAMVDRLGHGEDPPLVPGGEAARLRVPVDPSHVEIQGTPEPIIAVPGGPPADWALTMHNAEGDRTRSGLRIDFSLSAFEPRDGGPRPQLRWWIDRGSGWEELTGRRRAQSDTFSLEPGEARTVRLRVALPPDIGPPAHADGPSASLLSTFSAPWWPTGEDFPDGFTMDNLNTLVSGAP
ncbi:hypothetical protein [Streptomyces mesophilus]|uniref:hypothetical protein n=1 Tax=Streptomyces mesophilus TaxID=1775132 RepID=UPI0033326BB1